MQPNEALSATAQISIALAGFAGVVVAFRSGSVHEWTKIDKFRLGILLSNSALPFLMSIFAMVLLSAGMGDRVTWRLCSVIAFVLAAVSGQLLSKFYGAFSRSQLKESGSRPWVFYASGLLAICVTLLQIYNVIRLQSFWPFFAIIGTWLWLAMIQFILLVTARPHSDR